MRGGRGDPANPLMWLPSIVHCQPINIIYHPSHSLAKSSQLSDKPLQHRMKFKLLTTTHEGLQFLRTVKGVISRANVQLRDDWGGEEVFPRSPHPLKFLCSIYIFVNSKSYLFEQIFFQILLHFLFKFSVTMFLSCPL